MTLLSDIRLATPRVQPPRIGALRWLKKHWSGWLAPKTIGPGGLAGAEVRRALVIQLDPATDAMLLTTPLVAELEARFPGIAIDLLVASDAASTVFRYFDSIQRIVFAPSDSRNTLAWIAALIRCRRERYDLAIDLGASSAAGRFALAFARTRHRLGLPRDDDARWSLSMFAAPADRARLPVYLLRRALVCEEQRNEARYPPTSLRLTPDEICDAGRSVAASTNGKPVATRRVIGVLSAVTTPPAFTATWWTQLVDELHRIDDTVEVIDVVGHLALSASARGLDPAALPDLRMLVAVLSTLDGVIVTDEHLLATASASTTPFVRLYGGGCDVMSAPSAAPAMSIDTRSPRQLATAMLRLFAGDAPTRTATDAAPRRLPCSRGTKRPIAGIAMSRTLGVASVLGVALACCPAAARAGGPLGIDHVIAYDNSGIWKRNYQTALAVGTAGLVAGGALWLGEDDPLGDTLWRSVDAMAFTAVTTEAMKFSFSRERPSQTSDPNRFFTGHGNQSFPSGEVAEISAAVTPLMMKYGPDHPAVYAFALLPLYDAVARVKVHGHWQSDVLVGAAIGAGLGYYAANREHALIVGWLPSGLQIGFSKSFQ